MPPLLLLAVDVPGIVLGVLGILITLMLAALGLAARYGAFAGKSDAVDTHVTEALARHDAADKALDKKLEDVAERLSAEHRESMTHVLSKLDQVIEHQHALHTRITVVEALADVPQDPPRRTRRDTPPMGVRHDVPAPPPPWKPRK